jgi:DNA-binding NarL/FixJ family response regulator
LSQASFAAAVRLVLAGGSYSPVTPEIEVEQERPRWLDLLEPAEYQLLTCVARGLTNKEIAREMRCPEADVQAGLAALFRKAGARTRSHLAAQAALAGVV